MPIESTEKYFRLLFLYASFMRQTTFSDKGWSRVSSHPCSLCMNVIQHSSDDNEHKKHFLEQKLKQMFDKKFIQSFVSFAERHNYLKSWVAYDIFNNDIALHLKLILYYSMLLIFLLVVWIIKRRLKPLKACGEKDFMRLCFYHGTTRSKCAVKLVNKRSLILFSTSRIRKHVREEIISSWKTLSNKNDLIICIQTNFFFNPVGNQLLNFGNCLVLV